jgi:hypothetical protein
LLAVLPVLALALCVVGCRRRLTNWREAALSGAVMWGLVLVAITESLGVFGLLEPVPVSILWAGAICVGFIWVGRPRRWPERVALLPRADAASLAVLAPLGAILGVLGILTVATAPNTWDAMTYHLARLIQWQQSGSLAPYPTHILRQLYLQPGAEYVVLHLTMLAGSDRLAGSVQWGALVGSLIGCALIAERLGARRSGVWCAVAAAVSIPIGVLEATSTQNDYVVTFWLVCLVAFGLRIVNAERPTEPWWVIGGIGASLGLALLTKATAYLALPFVLWIALGMLRRGGASNVPRLLAVGALALGLNAGLYARNFAVFGSPLGPSDEGSPSLRYLNDSLTPALFASNVVRDVGLNFVATPFTAINVRALNAVQAVHAALGVDIQDPRTTWGGEQFREQRPELAFDENFAGNPLQVVLLVCALLALVAFPRPVGPHLLAYASALVLSFLLFGAVLRWQPWHTRLELPFLVLGAPPIGVVAERLSPRLAQVSIVALVLCTVPWVVNNQARPLTGPRAVWGMPREQQYFIYQPDLERPYRDALAYLQARGCGEVGFRSNQDGWEYPVRALGSVALRVQQVAVDNASAELPEGDAGAPCAVLALGPAYLDQSLTVGSAEFAPTWKEGDVAVLTPALDGTQ